MNYESFMSSTSELRELRRRHPILVRIAYCVGWTHAMVINRKIIAETVRLRIQIRGMQYRINRNRRWLNKGHNPMP